ncbi:hypothetical protein [Alkalimonas mucilaginosa]|uniref:CHAT domain-containing protein n=1 Tax=Alkalimonas mucilaginosa TaxID=3057676 RepID=A0ABU7JGR0_9GAMM|nr:hypothetical protein [Alkalimonas sp. MEB004]MEE2024871.1 hypothetical protein [Alkalimonas sp. MEB004]
MSIEVLIIESRSFGDIYNNVQEGRTLRDVLQIQNIKSDYQEVATKEQLGKALKRAGKDSIKYIHFSAHGAKDGFELTNGEFIDWESFDDIGWPNLKGKCVVFSSCDIAKGVSEVFDYHKTFCNAFVAPTRKILWSEGIVAFSAFYHRAMKQDSTVEQDVKVMNSITVAGTFKYIPASPSSATYVIGG